MSEQYPGGGDDWSTPPPPQGSYTPDGRPVGAPGLSDGIGSADVSTALFGKVQDHVKRFFATVKGPMLNLFLAISGISLALMLLQSLIRFIAIAANVPALMMVNGLLAMIGAVVSFFGAVITVALFQPARAVARGLITPPASLGEAFALARPALLPALLVSLVFAAAVGFGSMCCLIPGVIAYIALMPARYLSTAREMELGQALSTSIDVGKRYWLLLLVTGFAFVVILGIAGAIGAGGMAAASAVGMAGAQSASSNVVRALIIEAPLLIAVLFQWVLVTFAAAFYWMVEGGVMMTIEDDNAF